MRSISARLYLLRLSSLYLLIIFLSMLTRTTSASQFSLSEGAQGVSMPKASFPYQHPTQKTATAKKLYLFDASPLRLSSSRSTSPVNDSATINFAGLSSRLISSRSNSLNHHHFSSKSSSSSSLSAMYHHSKLSHDIGRIKRSRAIRDSFQALNQLVLEKADYGTIAILRPPRWRPHLTCPSLCLISFLPVYLHTFSLIFCFFFFTILPFSWLFRNFSCPEWLAVTLVTAFYAFQFFVSVKLNW